VEIPLPSETKGTGDKTGGDRSIITFGRLGMNSSFVVMFPHKNAYMRIGHRIYNE